MVRDDLITRKGKLLNETEVWKFGQSWRVGGKKACAREHDTIKTKERTCSKFTKWSQHACSPLIRNKFGNCDKKLNPAKYYRACLLDMCECPHQKCYCESFTAYAHECERLGVHLDHWRGQLNCYMNETELMSTSTTSLMTNSANVLPYHVISSAEAVSKNTRLMNRKRNGHGSPANGKHKKLQPPKGPKNIVPPRGPPPPLFN